MIDSNTLKSASFDNIKIILQDFHTDQEIEQFMTDCDRNLDHFISFEEYVICRGKYDSYGNLNEVNEYDLRSAIVVNDFEETLRSGKEMSFFKYDENGIIIDDEL
jgi:hypothetical protein